ncbi:MAG: phosphatase PAP2 family protein, partial [Acidimicrobiales bacterium]
TGPGRGAALMISSSPAPTTAELGPGRGLRWWREVLLVVVFYLIYSWIRNQFGSASVSADTAFANAERVIDLEKGLGLYIEADIQSWFVDIGWFLRATNIFYGTAHFLVTAFALIWLYRRHPQDYGRWRTIGLTTTALALFGFAVFALMPPRLLGDCGDLGACVASPYVDTLAVHGGWWSFDSAAVESISNQYAAMPSLHIAWAFWSYLVLAPRLRSPLGRVLISIYPWLTLFAIIVTANHYWIDAVGGAVALAGGYFGGTWLHNRIQGHTAARHAHT